MATAAATDTAKGRGPTPEQQEWASKFCGISTKAEAPVGDAPGGGSKDGGTQAAKGALPATDDTLFFEQDSAALTPDGRQVLDAYAQAYAKAGAADQVKVDAYASSEGADDYNQKLSDKRAHAVADYLAKQGVPAQKVSAKGHGETAQFSKDDLRQNRRATITPPIKSQAAAGPDGGAPPPVDRPEGDKPIRLYPPDEEMRKVVGDPKPPEPCTVKRAEVETELTDFLTKLAKAQGTRSVKVTDRVRLAGNALAKGLGDLPMKMMTALQDDRFNFEPKDLAHKIAAVLPDEIPCENFEALKKMAPKEIGQAGGKSVLDAVYEKVVDPVVKAVTKPFPEAVQKKALELAHDAVEKGVSAGVKAAAKQLGLDDKGQEAIEQAVEAAIKQKPPS